MPKESASPYILILRNLFQEPFEHPSSALNAVFMPLSFCRFYAFADGGS
jgi:hypothetical protein